MADLTETIKDRFVPIQAVSAVLSCTDQHVYSLVMEGSLQAIKIGSRAIRISERSLNEFIENSRVNPDDFFDPDKDKKEVAAAPQPVRSNWMTK